MTQQPQLSLKSKPACWKQTLDVAALAFLAETQAEGVAATGCSHVLFHITKPDNNLLMMNMDTGVQKVFSPAEYAGRFQLKDEKLEITTKILQNRCLMLTIKDDKLYDIDHPSSIKSAADSVAARSYKAAAAAAPAH